MQKIAVKKEQDGQSCLFGEKYLKKMRVWQ